MRALHSHIQAGKKIRVKQCNDIVALERLLACE